MTTVKVMASLCADDKAGPNNQYVESGKLVIVHDDIRGTPIRGMERMHAGRNIKGSGRHLRGGTETLAVRKSRKRKRKYLVRRLTPLECERLQGLPDGYTDIPDKTCSDSARYKALGNGMAQPCPDFIIKRITECVNEREKI